MTIANNIKSTLPKIDSAKELMIFVEDRCQTTDKSLTGTLMSNLTTMKFNSSYSIHEHVLEMTNIIIKLKTLGIVVDEYFLAQFILNS